MAAGEIQPLTDYTTMSGAEFKRAVGADPEKWAAAFIQRGHMPAFIHADMVAWFRDFAEATLRAHRDLTMLD